MSDTTESSRRKIYNFIQSITKSKRKTGYIVIIRGMQVFTAAHSNTFPFIPLIFLERQFPPCTRASHILCRCCGIVHCLSPFIFAASLITLSFFCQEIRFSTFCPFWMRVSCEDILNVFFYKQNILINRALLYAWIYHQGILGWSSHMQGRI